MSIDYEKIAKELVAEKVTFCKGTDREHISYEPVYFDQGYSDGDEEVMSAFVSGELTKDGYPLWRELAEKIIDDWGGDAVWHDAGEIVEEYEKFLDVPLADDFDTDELRDAIRQELQEVQTQDVALDWVKDMRPPNIRVMLTDEDHEDSWVENDEDWTPERLATNAGIEHTEKNLKACQVILDNAYCQAGAPHGSFRYSGPVACRGCSQPVVAYSQAGAREVAISGMCEPCFDFVMQHPDDRTPAEQSWMQLVKYNKKD